MEGGTHHGKRRHTRNGILAQSQHFFYDAAGQQIEVDDYGAGQVTRAYDLVNSNAGATSAGPGSNGYIPPDPNDPNTARYVTDAMGHQIKWEIQDKDFNQQRYSRTNAKFEDYVETQVNGERSNNNTSQPGKTVSSHVSHPELSFGKVFGGQWRDNLLKPASARTPSSWTPRATQIACCYLTDTNRVVLRKTGWRCVYRLGSRHL